MLRISSTHKSKLVEEYGGTFSFNMHGLSMSGCCTVHAGVVLASKHKHIIIGLIADRADVIDIHVTIKIKLMIWVNQI